MIILPLPLIQRLYSHFQGGFFKLVYKLPTIELESIIQEYGPPCIPIMEDICLPPYFGPKGHDDFSPLIEIVRWLNPDVVIELGTAYGNTTANICQQCSSATIYTVNAPLAEQTGAIVTFELSNSDIGRVYKAHGFSDRVVQIYKNTLDLDFENYLDNPCVDLAVIDACHDTEYVINDFFKVREFIRPGGVVLFHDTHPSMEGHLKGSYLACLELRRQGFDIHHVKNTWWAIWINDNS